MGRATRLSSAALCAMVLGNGMTYAAQPREYGHDQVPHEVLVPRVETAGDLAPDLAREPWTRAARLTGNLDWRRIRTADLPITTYLFYDAEALYVGYRSETTAGKDLRAEVRERDADLKRDDHLNLELDVGPTGRVFYRFLVNSLGAVCDSVIIDKKWNSTAQVKTATDERGWTAVMRIPFSDFNRGEPAGGTHWTFNLSTRSGFDNSWAPVFGGYHIPEQFSKLVFAGAAVVPARLRELRPLRIGTNVVRVEAPANTLWELEGVDHDLGTLLLRAGEVGANGEVRFDLVDDRIDHVNFVFRDPSGRTLLSFWRPAEIPEILRRLPAFREKTTFLKENLERLPETWRPQIRSLLAEAESVTAMPAPADPAAWKSVHDKLWTLERSVGDAWVYARTLTDLSPKAAFGLTIASPMDKVMIKDHPCPGVPSKTCELSLARNEHEAVQVVVIPAAAALKKLTVTTSPATSRDGAAFQGTITTALVGHVKTQPAGSYLPDYVGWYPDPILDFQNSCDAAVGEHIAFWVDVSTTPDAAPGAYQSTITVTADGCEPLKLPLNIRVWDIRLPDGSRLRNAFTYTETNTKQLYKERWSDQLARKYHDFILDHRLNIDSLYGKQEREPALMKHGAERGMNAFNVFYVGKGADPEVVGNLLKERMPALKAAGIDRLAYLYGFDEVNDEDFPRMKAVFGKAAELYPDLPRMTTGYDNTFGRTTGLRDYVDIWVPLIPEYDAVEAERLRAEGNEMWWYLCVGPRHPYPNWFVESPTIESRLLMGAMSYKYRVGGVLYFMMNGWKLIEKPISTGPYTDWFPGSGKSRDGCYANGDGSIFCAGPDGPVTTQRFENIRDGLEDYEYLKILEDVAARIAGQPPTLERAGYLKRARELLGIPETVVESSSRYTGDPQAVYALRGAIVDLILEGRALSRR